MTTPITYPQGTITGRDAAVLHDNLVTPDSDLVSRAVAQILEPYYEATYERAQARYRDCAENGTETQKAAMPIFTDRNAMIDWYVALDDTQNATKRHAESEKANFDNQIAKANEEKSQFETALNALDTQSPSYEEDRKPLQAEIDRLAAEITDHETKKGALPGE